MIDRTKLEALLGNDENMVQRFLEIFKTQTSTQLKLLRSSIGTHNWEQTSITAHAIKIQCRYLGLENIAEYAAQIEQFAEQEKQLDLLPGLAIQLESQLSSIIGKEFS
jgi:HPt (histidine-containing phosphotransfer) domain-containing protein